METPGKVTGELERGVFELEHRGPVIRLTLTHDRLTEEGMAGGSLGWPGILSSLKSLLETGTAFEHEQFFE